jgi:glycosyltransferase involved in cell wall biosynthesis/SAM-dependent methyltransferase
MHRICLVVHRYGREIVGGSEQLARCYAHLLKGDYEVHVVTSCAADHISWSNKYPPGVSDDDGVTVHRFEVDFERGEFWHQLHYVLLLEPVISSASRTLLSYGDHDVSDWTRAWNVPGSKETLGHVVEHLPIGIQEEFIRRQGPYSTALLRFLSAEQEKFDVVLFFTYLYATTYFGSKRVPRSKAILCPTLHDEPPAYLPVFHTMMQSFDRIIFLSEGERAVARTVCNVQKDGDVIGMPIETSIRSEAGRRPPNGPYVAYCGRIEGAKGSATLFEYFSRYKDENPSDLKLVLTGHAVSDVPKRRDIEYVGYATEEQKLVTMQNALAFVHPSPFESFSIVLLEALLCGTPTIVNGDCLVLREHVRASGAGFAYSKYEEFAQAMTCLIHDRELRDRMGENGRTYVRENFSTAAVLSKLRAALDLAVAQPGATETSSVADAVNDQSAPETEAASAVQPVVTRAAIATCSVAGQGSTRIPTTRASASSLLPNIAEDLTFSSGKLNDQNLRRIRDYLSESIVTPEATAELMGYIQEALQRFVFTMCLVPNGRGRLLELGANPYFLTLLLKRLRGYDLELANFFSEHHSYDANTLSEQEIVNSKYDERHTFRFRTFNIEKDKFPYGDASLDVVLFCEIIEHLTADPVAALGQICRVLRPGGHLVLTTPNVSRRENQHRLAHGHNIYDPYSRYGIYGRHNREYTVAELSGLVSNLGFEVEVITTKDVHGDWDCGAGSCRVRPKVSPEGGQYIFMRARKVTACSLERPAWLYR